VKSIGAHGAQDWFPNAGYQLPFTSLDEKRAAPTLGTARFNIQNGTAKTVLKQLLGGGCLDSYFDNSCF
jgi:hypothetical protein